MSSAIRAWCRAVGVDYDDSQDVADAFFEAVAGDNLPTVLDHRLVPIFTGAPAPRAPDSGVPRTRVESGFGASTKTPVAHAACARATEARPLPLTGVIRAAGALTRPPAAEGECLRPGSSHAIGPAMREVLTVPAVSTGGTAAEGCSLGRSFTSADACGKGADVSAHGIAAAAGPPRSMCEGTSGEATFSRGGPVTPKRQLGDRNGDQDDHRTAEQLLQHRRRQAHGR